MCWGVRPQLGAPSESPLCQWLWKLLHPQVLVSSVDAQVIQKGNGVLHGTSTAIKFAKMGRLVPRWIWFSHYFHIKGSTSRMKSLTSLLFWRKFLSSFFLIKVSSPSLPSPFPLLTSFLAVKSFTCWKDYSIAAPSPSLLSLFDCSTLCYRMCVSPSVSRKSFRLKDKALRVIGTTPIQFCLAIAHKSSPVESPNDLILYFPAMV